jgi:4'-phosphopantetheinyl transferase
MFIEIDFDFNNTCIFISQGYDRKNELRKMPRFVKALTAYLAKTSINTPFDTNEIDIINIIETNGKPQFKIPELNGIEFSISHSKDFYAVAFSNKQIGLDIEYFSCTKRTPDQQIKIARRFFHPSEIDYLLRFSMTKTTELNKEFLKIWTAKEAYVKLLGKGISYGFDKFSVIERMDYSDIEQPKNINIKTSKIDQLIYSLSYTINEGVEE